VQQAWAGARQRLAGCLAATGLVTAVLVQYEGAVPPQTPPNASPTDHTHAMEGTRSGTQGALETIYDRRIVRSGPSAAGTDDGGGGGGGAPPSAPPSLEETLHGLRFQVSAQAFFQVHTAAAERLAAVLSECAAMPAAAFPPPFAGAAAATTAALATPPTTGGAPPVLLDVCCGAGTLGLIIAQQHGGQLLGVESCGPAVEDARRNALANGFMGQGRATFVCGAAEDEIDELLRHRGGGGGGDVIAVVDPPRTGLKPSVCAALRAQVRAVLRAVLRLGTIWAYMSFRPRSLLITRPIRAAAGAAGAAGCSRASGGCSLSRATRKATTCASTTRCGAAPSSTTPSCSAAPPPPPPGPPPPPPPPPP
jgi:predicted RNA methylase